jgi:Predicted transporter component
MIARFVVILVAGALFGAGLAISGMSNPARVLGFLDLTGAWDPALVFVMAGAVLTFGGGMLFLRSRRRGVGWFGTQLPARDHDPIDRRLIVGALIFGAGWGLAGFCPGPAIANLVALRTDALLFLPAMAVGMLLARFGFHADAD